MRLWADVYEADGTPLGLVNLVSAEINRELDAAGDMQLQAVGSDEASRLLAVRRRVRVWWLSPARGRELLAEGVLIQRQMTLGAEGRQLMWTAADSLDELRNANTFRGRVYEDAEIDAVVDDLLSLAPGWVADTDLDGALATTTSRRFDGQNVLAALRTVAQGVGLHLRLKTPRRLQVGKFGQSDGVVVTNLRQMGPGTISNRRLALLEALTIVEDGFELVNVIEPVWGSGSAVITLRNSTRTAPYTIMPVTQADGFTGFRLEDAASIAQYGRVERVVAMQDAPLANEATRAANVLYDWATAWLERRREPVRTYAVTVVKPDWPVLPGDKVRLRYKGEVVSQRGLYVADDDIDEEFFVIRASEIYDGTGARAMWEISSVDLEATQAANLLADALLAMEATQAGQKLTATALQNSATESLNPSTPFEVDLPTQAGIVEMGALLLRVTREAGSTAQHVRLVLVPLVGSSVELAGGLLGMPPDSGPPVSEEVRPATFPVKPEGSKIRVECLSGSGDVTLDIEVGAVVLGA
jgi:hypothetical protein